MQMRQGAPSLARPSSPSKRIARLADIPEATPGPNAFAQQAARMDQHRLAGNAFYQQQVAQRRVTPPTATHPAFRTGSDVDPFPLNVANNSQRESTATTMSHFINAGKEPALPPFRLVPSTGQMSIPTKRGVIEEEREQIVHEASGSDRERVPVYQTYVPTPKPASEEFTATPRKPRISLPNKKDVTSVDAPKSPRKNLFGKLRFTKFGGGTPSPSISTLASEHGLIEEGDIPPKAQAVLGASTSKNQLARSPSKQKKGLFSRKAAEVTDINTSNVTLVQKSGMNETVEPPRSANSIGILSQATSSGTDERPRTAGSVRRTPQSASTDPTHYSFTNGRHMLSQTFSGRGIYRAQDADQCPVQRTQSLKYMDSVVPPTPPAKNTPPDENVKKAAAASQLHTKLLHQTEGTPSKTAAGIVYTGGRLSPTKFGSYAHKEAPTLVTKPSIYSLHASVVPEMIEVGTFKDLKERIDGLGLEGFNTPAENYYRNSQEMTYSSSIYSTDWGARPSMIANTPRSGHRKTMDDLPTLREAMDERDRESHHTKQSSSSGMTIPIIYPGLASDPSVQDMTPHLNTRPASEEAVIMRQTGAGGMREDDDTPLHGRTHSRNDSDGPNHSLAADVIKDPSAGEVIDAGLFSTPAPEDSPETIHSSPASYNHPSAMPSPLYYLPATIYIPPPKKVRGRRKGDGTPSTVKGEEGLGIFGHQSSAPGSPPRCNNMFENAPVFAAHATARKRASPRTTTNALADDRNVNVDPRKPQVAGEDSAEQRDLVLALLNKILERDNAIQSIRGEVYATNTRLDTTHTRLNERLAAMEHSQSHSPPTSYGFDGSSSQHELDERSNQQYVATSINGSVDNRKADADSRKPGMAGAGHVDKQDLVLGLLNKILERDNDMRAIRDEAYATNARLDKRLVAMKPQQGSPPSTPFGRNGSPSQYDQSERSNQHRVATSFAHDFYRERPQSPNSADAVSSVASHTEADTIAELREANRQLVGMVHGLAAKFEEMQRKIG